MILLMDEYTEKADCYMSRSSRQGLRMTASAYSTTLFAGRCDFPLCLLFGMYGATKAGDRNISMNWKFPSASRLEEIIPPPSSMTMKRGGLESLCGAEAFEKYQYR